MTRPTLSLVVTGSADDIRADKIVKFCDGSSFNETAFRREAAKIAAAHKPWAAPPRKLTDDEFDDNQHSIETGNGAIY